ncbi:isoprenylcysteine carboxyl methyltransferase family protein [Sunxiuqinia indica]|uniref:isoprenylcysteine carboxyl methyltransferase family protein n=1 Tax=Sunxiuqinia indica TaxID=2692584 RepID=UPI00135A0C34|nr:isoprenylcysteine carboxylmethyltransferase family protein [Sunxiuqinia indica]
MAFVLFISFLILLRLSELLIARRNEIWLRANGAVEYGKKHYPFIVLLHLAFMLSLVIEYLLKPTETPDYFLLALLLALIAVKMHIIYSLGRYWNTKILHIAGVPLVRKGLYKYFKHPNYFIVISEIAVIPLIFHLYVTAIVFSVLNAIMLFIRIKAENKILKQA